MIYLQDENDYDDTDDENSKLSINEKLNDYEYNEKISIIGYYKNLLSYEPEFIGIKNISTGLLLRIIDMTRNSIKLNKKDYRITREQYNLFNKLYEDLEIIGNMDLYNTVTKKIFSIIYV